MSMAATTIVPKSWKGPALQFNILKECSKSRCRTAKLTLPHHTLETPTFMPVGTKGTMKGLLPEQVSAAGADIILGNTYHLGTQPGPEILDDGGGLHHWMKWSRGLLTDSGGFQMVSLLKFAKITEQGVTFESPYDGSECVLTPEESIRIQNAIGADIMMQLDDVVDVKETDYDRFKEATLRTTRWLDRCIAANTRPKTQNLFPIVQGGLFKDLRELSITQLMERDSPGYAVGGLSGGENKHQFWSVVHQCTSRLPRCKPRYCMGVGYAPDLVVCVALGVDMFDCVYPTRTARFGSALLPSGQINLKQERYSMDFSRVDSDCDCRTCQRYTRAYIHQAFTNKTSVACHLISVHNIAYQMRLMAAIRKSVSEDSFPQFVRDFLATFYGAEPVPQWITEALAAVDIHIQQSDCHSAAEILEPTSDVCRDSLAEVDSCDKSTIDSKFSKDDWCDDDDDEHDDCSKLSGFENRAYNVGYSESLRQDYPQDEEKGRQLGFRDAFTAICVEPTENSAPEDSKLHKDLQSTTTETVLETSKRKFFNPVRELANLEGNLSLMLFKYQDKMNDDQLRNVINMRKAIKDEISKITMGYDDHYPGNNTYCCCATESSEYIQCERIVSKAANITSTSDQPLESFSFQDALINECCNKKREPVVLNTTTYTLVANMMEKCRDITQEFNSVLPKY